MELHQIFIFIVASLTVICTPGQDLMLVMSRAISSGARAGVLTATGVSLGLLVHSLIAACGVGALLLNAKSVFTAIKLIGACYLFYLGIRMILRKQQSLHLSCEHTLSLPRLLFTGAFSNISNPHVTLFFLAFLPQFIDEKSSHPALLLFELGVGFALLTILIKGPVGFFAGILSQGLIAHPQILVWINRISGIMLIGLGLRLLFSRYQ